MTPIPDLPPFDPKRAHFVKPPQRAQTIRKLTSLQEALANEQVNPHTPLLIMHLNGTAITFITRQIVFLHVVQGKLTDGTAWMVAFCSVCNNGTAFSPVIDEKAHTFGVVGMYNAMILLYDEESGSYWDHIRGDCVSGVHRGTKLTRLTNVLHTHVSHVLATYPDAQIAVAELTVEEEVEAQDEDTWRTTPQPEWSAGLVRLLDQEDTRLPRLDMGIGVWSDSTQRYYPLSQLYAENNALLDKFDGRSLLIYIEPDSAAPMALFTDATSFMWRNEALYLNNGDIVQNGTVLCHDGSLKAVERPLQLFSRWFGFSIKFPGCEIYGFKARR